MTSNLVPEQRVDKNGRVVTRHVRNGGKSHVGPPRIPSPAAPVVKKKAPKLLARQQDVQTYHFPKAGYSPSPALRAALPSTEGASPYSFVASDVTAYELFSVMNVDNAIHMNYCGYRSKDDALAFLTSHGLNSIIEDNSAMMDEALARRIPATSVANLHSAYGSKGHRPGLFLDAAEAYSSGTLSQIDKSRPDSPRVYVRVLSGDIAWADIKSIGVSAIQKSNAAHDVLDALQSMKTGELKCTVGDIANLIAKNNDESNASFPLKWALSSINKYGVGFLTGTQRLLRASSTAEHFESKNAPVDKIKEYITYEERMLEVGAMPPIKLIPRLVNSGVDAESAGKLYKSGKSVDQIITIHNEGIPTAVASGWL